MVVKRVARAFNLRTALMAVATLAAMNAQAALIATDGGLGVYDTTNEVTWTSDANLMATQAANYSGGAPAFVSQIIAASGGTIPSVAYGGTYTLSPGDFNTSTGQMDWFGARAWVNYLNTIKYGGSNTWALPTTVDNISSLGFPDGASGNPVQTSSQLAELFYGGLGQAAGSSILTTHNSNLSLFTNVQSFIYWSGSETLSDNFLGGEAYDFFTATGRQDYYYESGGDDFDALAVSPGQLGTGGAAGGGGTTVPLPATGWLMLSALGGLGVVMRRRAAVAAITRC